MKIFVASFVLFSIVAGLSANCIKRHPQDKVSPILKSIPILSEIFCFKCIERHFPEPEPKEIHYIYHGDTCNCPKYHDTIVEKPKECAKEMRLDYTYAVDIPVERQPEQIIRYAFDVHVEKPEPSTKRP
jgi:hypothetical protein